MRMSEYDPIAIRRASKARGMDDALVCEHVQGEILTDPFTGRRRAAWSQI
jgi:hypothetical protein